MKQISALLAVFSVTGAAAAEPGDIVNFRQYSDSFASAGQPTAEQLGAVADAGYQRVIYIAWSDHENSLPNEDRVVGELGMQYLHLPVAWDKPKPEDFRLFAAAMRAAPERKTLLHCQVNFRASAFGFLYRVIYENVPVADAKRDMNDVWTPNEIWRAFIFDVLDAHGISQDCEGCDWSVPTG